jgi:hypothetical protein
MKTNQAVTNRPHPDGCQYALRREANSWEVTFEGRPANFKHELGGLYPAHLLLHPPPEPNLSGFQLFAKINCILAQFGQDQVDAPPAQPQFPDLAPQGLVITNTVGVVALELTCPANPGENIIIRSSALVSQGRETCDDFRILGTCPAPAAGSADITSLYAGRYGVPPVAKKVYVRVNQFIDGWESLPTTFWAIVPA